VFLLPDLNYQLLAFCLIFLIISLLLFLLCIPQASVYNLNRGLTEKFGRLLVAFADDYREVEEVTAGNIAVLSGLKASGEDGEPALQLANFTFVLCIRNFLVPCQFSVISFSG
jgi:hypothetical protein